MPSAGDAEMTKTTSLPALELTFINVCPTPTENTAHAGKFTDPWQFLRDSLKRSCNVQGFSASQQESLGCFGHEENVTRALVVMCESQSWYWEVQVSSQCVQDSMLKS